MGLRTATVRRLAVPDTTTTGLTTVLAGLAADSSLAGGNNVRMGRRIGSVVAMSAGASIGTLFLRLGLAVPLLVGEFASLPRPLLTPQARQSMTPNNPVDNPLANKRLPIQGAVANPVFRNQN
jgi:Protein of unknown function (DUF1275)